MKKIPLTQGKFALVDDTDYEELSKHNWYALKYKHTFYAVRSAVVDGVHVTIRMSRELLGLKPGDKRQGDHGNLNGLDNQRHNLRVCTQPQNTQNRGLGKNNKSGYKGVRWNKSHGKWYTQISVNGIQVHLGCFFCLIKAAKAYDTAARKHFGEFARCNFALDPQ